MIYGHGDDGYLLKQKLKADFSSNVFYGGMPEGLRLHLQSCLNKIENYPESNAQSLQEEIGQWHALSASNVLVSNGATEAFYLIAQAFKTYTATVITPAFAEYEDACLAAGLQTEFLSWNLLNENAVFKTDLVFLGNPNNPSGDIISKEILTQVLSKNPQTVFVVDEAYADFCSVSVSMVPALKDCDNLIVVKSLTKTYAIPGLRLGYLLSHPHTIQKILKIKMPWSVNALAIEAGLYIARNRKDLALPLGLLLEDTNELIRQIRQIDNFEVCATHTNFFLCKTLNGTASKLKEFLIEKHALLIRDASNFKDLGPQHFRIATQRREKNELLILGLTAWMKNF